jgi:hypothetical protein
MFFGIVKQGLKFLFIYLNLEIRFPNPLVGAVGCLLIVQKNIFYEPVVQFTKSGIKGFFNLRNMVTSFCT